MLLLSMQNSLEGIALRREMCFSCIGTKLLPQGHARPESEIMTEWK